MAKPAVAVVSDDMVSATSSAGTCSSGLSEIDISSLSLDVDSGSIHDDGGTHNDVSGFKETISLDARESYSQHQPCDSQSTIVYGDEPDEDPPAIMSPRAYQLEMLDLSLKQNAIVVMDTGSGKTQVAVMRIKAELERCEPNKVVWFLAPTVALCGQQFDVIQLQATSVPMKLLTGNDNVDTWSVGIWESVLNGVRVVVSTYQVLLDALCHAFISIDRLSLIVFDEAHNCSGKHPGSKIMTDFYHRNKKLGRVVPSILGITATPSMTEDIQNIDVLETVLDARCISPTLHREELVKFVKRPEIRYLSYDPTPSDHYTRSMARLQHEYLSLNIAEDPFVLRLQQDPTERNLRELARAVEKYDTFVQNQIKGLWGRCVEIFQQLGSWAADLYIWRAATAFLKRVERNDTIFEEWFQEEKRYLADFLRRLDPPRPTLMPQSGSEVSEKVSALVQELVSIDDPIVCIIFAKERATVSALCDLLASSPLIAEKHHLGSVVGSSNYQSRRNALYELPSETDQVALESFRSGKINILVATSVVEEGIDVPACNMVVCFDHPATPKSFIQRRGRARMKDSTLLLLSEHSSSAISRWEALEEDMKMVFQDTQREIQVMQTLEESEETSSTYFEVKSTGARLDFDNAKSHLEHFCRVLSMGEYVDSRPDYIIHRYSDTTPPTLRATVLLPTFVPSELRQCDSKFSWLSEKNATKDAAFQAYCALYKAGLLNQHLLPFKYEDMPGLEGRASEVDVDAIFDPWVDVAEQWKQGKQVWKYNLASRDDVEGESDYDLLLPVELDRLQSIKTYINHNEVCELKFTSTGQTMSAIDAATIPDHMSTLLALHFSHRWPVEDKQHIIKLSARKMTMSMDCIGARVFDPTNEDMIDGKFLVRDESNTPFHYMDTLPSKPPAEVVQSTFFDYDNAPEMVPYLVVRKWTKRSDFLHALLSDAPPPATKMLFPRVVPLPWATVDSISLKYAKFGMLIPSILHELQVMLIAKSLSQTILKDVNITDLGLVRQAISSRSAVEPLDYERPEFLGDSILKFCATIQVSALHPEWPEGYLSFFKDSLVSNSRLSRAAIDMGLSKFILTKSFTGQKWRPKYLEDYLNGDHKRSSPRKLSTKTLADVVEALIGASYINGGIGKAQACISTFINDVEWQDIRANREVIFNIAGGQDILSPELKILEELIGYDFQKKSLLIEAMTHPSCLFDHGRRCYEHLEFIGDAVLDFIVVQRLYSVEPPLPHHQLHLLKTAVVNGDFLAFSSLEYKREQTEPTVTSDLRVIDKETKPLSLWNFMRHSSESIGVEQRATLRRFEALRGDVLAALNHGTHYPWALLARLHTRKFFSDVFESLLGAVWIDSGSIEECEAILTRFGVLPCLDRLIVGNVQVQHPKEVIGKLAVTETVTYEIDVRGAADGERAFTCRVRVGQRLVAEVHDGVTKEEAKTRAAEAAVRILSKERGGNE